MKIFKFKSYNPLLWKFLNTLKPVDILSPRSKAFLFALLCSFSLNSFAQSSQIQPVNTSTRTASGDYSSYNSETYPALSTGFDRNELVNSNAMLIDPQRFNMQQSYSMSYWSSSNGSSSSQGLYLNHMTYALANNLNMFVDVGYHTPFHSEFQANDPRISAFQDQSSSMVIPRFGLEYQPSESVFMSFQFINGNDAARAWGAGAYDPWMGSSFYSPWNRFNRRGR